LSPFRRLSLAFLGLLCEQAIDQVDRLLVGEFVQRLDLVELADLRDTRRITA
jgi:hypothetical protein